VRIHRAEPPTPAAPGAAAAATLAGAAALASAAGGKADAAEPMPTLDENAVPADYGLLDDSGMPVGDDGVSAGTDYVVAEPTPMPALDDNPVPDDYGLLEDSGSALADADVAGGPEPEPMPALDENPVAADHTWVDDSDAAPADASASVPAEEFPEVPRREPIPPRLLVERPAKDDDGHPLDASIPGPKIEPVRGPDAPAHDGRTELADGLPEDWVRQTTRGELDLDEED
jgi:hypothetical protein